jgi:hypothetical protein
MPDRELTGQYYLAVELPEISLLLRENEVVAVSRAIASLSADAAEWMPEDRGSRHMEKIAEARAFSGIAPHLSPSEFLARFVARSANTFDPTALELWFVPIPEKIARLATDLLHTSKDHAILCRILWVIPHLRISLTERDHDRLVDLTSSKDQMVSSGAIRVSVIGDDEKLGRRIVDLGVSAAPGIDPWAEQWITLLLGQFGGDLPFVELAKRLRPSAIGFIIGRRGNRTDEVEMYADCLDQEWRRIVSAEDLPEIERLPGMMIAGDEGESGGRLPQLLIPQRSRTIRFDRSDSWSSGPPTDPAVELKEFFSTNYEKQFRESVEDRRRKVDAILAAWRTDAFQWYGRIFSLEAMDLLYQQNPARVERWVQPAFAESPTGLAVRVRLGSFLEPICRVLLNRNPELGFRLWQVLRNRDSTPLVFDTTDIPFGADGSESERARRILIDECWNDAAIAQLVLAAVRWKRQDWIEAEAERLISDERLWKRVKGLALASFSDIAPDHFEEFVSRAAITNTWVEQSLPSIRRNVRKNYLARHWYRVFLTAENADTAWGALQIVLIHADERLLCWCQEIEGDCANRQLIENRLRFLGLGWRTRRDLREKLGREKERRERLFGIEIQPGEIVPFMPSRK